MSILYVDCFSGIAGDMFLAALLDAGVPVEVLNEAFKSLPLDKKIELSSHHVRKGALDANLLHISINGEIQSETHAHTHGFDHRHDDGHHDHEHEHDHQHEHEHEQNHEHEHEHERHHHGHTRNLRDIFHLIEHTKMSERAAGMARNIFTKLAEAEAKVHGETKETIHFHEVGSIDSIIDILGACIGLDYLGVEQVYASALPFSTGHIHSDHGLIPVPAPATLALIEAAHMPLRPAPDAGELITPTGAAILATLATFQRPPMRINKVGIGAGNKNFDWPNILRVMLGEMEEKPTQPLIQISCNIDDMNPELYAPIMEHLFAAGAADVFLMAIQMKKNRPGTLLRVIAPMWLEQTLAEILLKESSTFGVRVEQIYRYEAQRKFKTISTPYGEIQIKQKWVNGELIGEYPEFEGLKSLSEQSQIPVEQLYREVLSLLK
jgi:uncharacterized protein (TIGR00299 family) protein